jgi:hypothetical protein
MTISAIVLCAHVASVSLSIRYGFLADAFSKKSISGKVYGLIGTSIFAGFLFSYVFHLGEN